MSQEPTMPLPSTTEAETPRSAFDGTPCGNCGQAYSAHYYGDNQCPTRHDTVGETTFAPVVSSDEHAAASGGVETDWRSRAVAAEVEVARLELLNAAHEVTIASLNTRLPEFASLRARLTEAEQRLAWLDSQVHGGAFGDVTFTASDSPPMRTVNVYLGEASLPVGVGTTPAEAIDAARGL